MKKTYQTMVVLVPAQETACQIGSFPSVFQGTHFPWIFETTTQIWLFDSLFAQKNSGE